MTWSTKQLAELAGSTVKAVRHYHAIGLLDTPERASNGYKLYGVDHLVRLLQIKRLSDLGMPLAQIAAMSEPDASPDDALRVIDTDVAESIERLQRVRAELALILRHQTPTDLPAGFGEGASELSDADRALLLIYSRVFTTTAMEDLREMVQDKKRRPIDAEFDSLPSTADEATRQELAERYAPYMQELTATYPWLSEPGKRAPGGRVFAGSVVGEAITALYNPAQMDVLGRAHAVLQAATND
ncbi:MerR family transcriptional regulator [Cryobacterium lactosi]|uniref:MerR family transcriptional regulator n=1 Tax=Cryobacterium lactosi TaxID=1259202 RepID=A0A4R9BWH6_9MICO|nr:MerR family transcriptional regulator [Cryobacterium lactosi]TFD92059.1 MerR family transcriptional regulator [Cryobacterium lactosi]